jgi:hypothetical protein
MKKHLVLPVTSTATEPEHINVVDSLHPDHQKVNLLNFKCFTEEEITQMWDNWANFNGFTGETCSQCQTNANLLALGGIGGWTCNTCGHFNFHLSSEPKAPHEHPDFGPDGETIRAGAAKSKKA